MSPQIQELIDKIKTEGIEAADTKAKEIESQAQASAEKILAEARKKADQMITQAKQETEKLQESSKMALAQASRDMILSLRKKMEELLGKITEAAVKDALGQEKLSMILEYTIQESVKDKKGVEIVLSEEDLKVLQEGLIAKLQKKMKEPITFRSSQDIEKGFTISFDEGKSCFDFTDASLAEYLGKYLNAYVGSILKEAIK